MKKRVLRLYAAGALTDTGLANAVTRGWITQEDADAARAAKSAE
ncbi:MAG: XkdX family protein [Oscillospiraceae bacterium]|nr:XkdX family protein [Oscillospiraceae bacterium]